MVAFHLAYRDGRVVTPPDEYMDLVLVPMYLHIDPLHFAEYPEMVRRRIRRLLMETIAGGWAGNPAMVKPKKAHNG